MVQILRFPVERATPPATLVEQLLLLDWPCLGATRMVQIIRFPVERCRLPKRNRYRRCGHWDAEMLMLSGQLGHQV